MTRYAASILMWVRKKPSEGGGDDRSGPCQVWENIVVIDANDPDDAARKASEYATHDAAANSTGLEIDAQPAEVVFMGVRKLSEIQSGEQATAVERADLFEVTSSELELRSYEDLLQFANGYAVILRYVN